MIPNQLEVDHRFPQVRWSEDETYDPNMSVDEIYAKFQLLTRQHNLWKSRYCENCAIEWIGNEVSCGVGMQRIDIMLSLFENDQRIVIPIELKACEPKENNVIQIQRYIDWIEQYYIPNRQGDIQPMLIAETMDNDSVKFKRVTQSFKDFNSSNRQRCKSLKYMEYKITDNSIDFRMVEYS